MNKEALSDAIGNLSDEKIEQAKGKQKNILKFTAKKWIALAACIALAITAVFGIPKLIPHTPTPPDVSTTVSDEPSQDVTDEPTTKKPQAVMLAHQVAAANYDDIPYYDNGLPDEEDLEIAKTVKGISENSFTKEINSFLGKANGENAVFSPAALYIALSVLAELTDGDSRQQILDFLDVPDTAALRENVRAMITSIYEYNIVGDEMPEEYRGVLSILRPATSLWLGNNRGVKLSEDVKNALENDYLTSLFNGDLSDEEYQEAYRNWVKEYTGGVYGEKEQLEYVFKLANTLLYAKKWLIPFQEENNFTGVFHTPDGDVQTEYMFSNYYADYATDYYEGSNFEAVNWYGGAWFILPKEGCTVDDVLQSGAYNELLRAVKNDELYPKDQDFTYKVQLTLPKFDITSCLDLKSELQEFGVTDVFSDNASFGSILDAETGKSLKGLPVLSSTQDTRMVVNEEGIAAVSFGKIDFGSGPSEYKYINMVLDRPFITMVASDEGLPLFTAVVNNPQQS